MNEREKLKKSIKAHRIIKNHMIWSMGAGFIPLPIADLVAVTAVQVDMIRQLSKLYNVDFSENEIKAIISSLTSTGLAGLGARAVKVIPVVGSVLGGVTMSVLSGAGTYALGEVFYKHFESGGSILDLDPEKVKGYYRERFEEGKEIAKKVKKEAEVADEVSEDLPSVENAQTESVDRIEQLERLKELYQSGFITEDEMKKMKSDILSS